MKPNNRLLIIAFYLLLTINLIYAQNNQEKNISDGPQIFYDMDSLNIKYFDNGSTKTFHIKKNDLTSFNGFLNDSNRKYIIPKYFKTPHDNYSDVEKIFVVSDIHGQYRIFKELLYKNGVIDRNDSWIWGNGHLVILGDVFDRGNKVHEILWLIYKLEKQAEEKGGTVHFLLGNHEVMVLQNDLRYVHNNYFTIAESFSLSVPELYGDNTFWGKWLRSKNIILKLDSLLFVHGGIHPKLIEQFNSITDINELIKKHLDTPREEIKIDTTLSLLFRSDGPIWYRGFFVPDSLPDVSNSELATILYHFGVEKIIVGHTTEDKIYTSHSNRVICVDGGIKDGLSGEGLMIVDEKYYAVDINGKQQLIIE